MKLSKYQGTELPIKYLALTNQICRGFFVVQKSYFTCGGFLYQMFLLVFSFTIWLTAKEREEDWGQLGSVLCVWNIIFIFVYLSNGKRFEID